MTRTEAEAIIRGCLNTIRETCIELIPGFEESGYICTMYVSQLTNAAWILEEGEYEDIMDRPYLLNIDDRKNKPNEQPEEEKVSE